MRCFIEGEKRLLVSLAGIALGFLAIPHGLRYQDQLDRNHRTLSLIAEATIDGNNFQLYASCSRINIPPLQPQYQFSHKIDGGRTVVAVTDSMGEPARIERATSLLGIAERLLGRHQYEADFSNRGRLSGILLCETTGSPLNLKAF